MVVLVLSSCGGGGGGGGLSQSVGQFIDDPVGGLTYSCASADSTKKIIGTTDTDGHFNYMSGQTCTFKVGNVTLGTLDSMPSDGKVTPQDVAGVSRSATASPSALAIAQFLQSLNDGTTSGKIVIPAATAAVLGNVQAVTLASNSGAISQSDLQTVVAAVGKTLVSAATAKSALDAQISSGNVVASSGSVSATATVVLNSIVVSSAIPSNAAGLAEQMTATGYFSDGSTKDLTSSVSWLSSDTTLATIGTSGIAQGLKKGGVTFTASMTPTGSSTAIKGTFLQTTTDPLLSFITITNSNSLPAGLTDQLTATATLTDGSTSDVTSSVTWSSSDITKATIGTTSGLVKGLVKGTSTITATYSTGTPITATYAETILDPTIFNLVISYVQSGITSMFTTTTTALQAILNYSDQSTKTVSSAVQWSVSPSSNATISINSNSTSNATLRAGSAGNTAISASYNNVSSNQLSLTVADLPKAQFVDDPVMGLAYACSSSTTQTSYGYTDSQGLFSYLPGQTCTFSIGKVTLGTLKSIPSDGKVTPQDVAGVLRTATNVPSAVAIAQFLQTLNDGSTTGKIVIPSATTTAFNASGVSSVTLAAPTGAISQSDLTNLVTTVIPTKTLVTATSATANLNTQMTQNNISISSGAVSVSAPVVLNSISVTLSSNNNPAGLTQNLAAMGYYSDGTTKDISSNVTWSSSDTNILVVANALATGQKAGNASVFASLTPSGSTTAISGSTIIMTAAPVVTSIAITNSNSLPAGLTDQLTATATLTDGSTSDVTSSVTWSSSDITKVTVDTSGLATGVAMGGATVTAQYTPSGLSSALSATFSESVLAPNAINLVIAYVQSGLTTIQNLATTLLKATVSFTNNTTQAVASLTSWTVTPTAGANVALSTNNNSATLTASQPGVISLIGSYLGLTSNTLNLTVTAAPPVVQNASASLNVLGVTASAVTGNITATDPQGYPLTYAIATQGNVGQATINNTTGVFIYTVTGHTTNSTDSFNVTVSTGVNSSVSQVSVMLNTDPLLRNQWHIQNVGYSAFSSVLPTSGFDMNVAGAWAAGYTGKGVKVAVVDTGLEIAHADLAANVDVANSRNLLTGTTNPTPAVKGEDHGTQVAGIIGSVAFNGKGGRGVAYGATLRGYNLLGSGVSQSNLNFGYALGLASYSADNDIFNESFGNSPSNLDPTTNSYTAINNNLLSMRGNKGAILIQSAGNEFVSFKDGTTVCNNANTYGVSCGDPATDTRRDGTLPIIVGALNADGVKSSYSNTGAAIWVAAPGGEYGNDSNYVPTNSTWYDSLYSWVKSFIYKPAITTTAFTGCQNAANGTTKENDLDAQGQNTYAPQCQYTALMNGTSSAAPNLSGVAALMLQANPNLGYRDVKYILAKTAKKVDANNTGVTTTSLITGSSAPVVLEQGWVKNAAGYWFANAYGFGAVDAAAAVSMAKSYTGYLSAQQSASLSMHYLANVNVPNGNTTGSTMTFSMSPGFSTIEQVIMFINVTASPALTCNQIELTSPSGTKSILMHAANGFSNSGVLQRSIPGTRFMSNAFYGETSTGTWTLRFLDYCTSTTRTSILSTDTQMLMLTGH